jgi:outer membrane biosynthesis protein TonB
VTRDPAQPLAQIHAVPLAHIDADREVLFIWGRPGHPAAPASNEALVIPVPAAAPTPAAPKPKLKAKPAEPKPVETPVEAPAETAIPAAPPETPAPATPTPEAPAT